MKWNESVTSVLRIGICACVLNVLLRYGVYSFLRFQKVPESSLSEAQASATGFPGDGCASGGKCGIQV